MPTEQMLLKSTVTIAGTLAVIALAATDVSLTLQMYFGRWLPLILLGPALAAAGAAGFALSLKSQR